MSTARTRSGSLYRYGPFFLHMYVLQEQDLKKMFFLYIYGTFFFKLVLVVIISKLIYYEP
jgi:hypothetical protein